MSLLSSCATSVGVVMQRHTSEVLPSRFGHQIGKRLTPCPVCLNCGEEQEDDAHEGSPADAFEEHRLEVVPTWQWRCAAGEHPAVVLSHQFMQRNKEADVCRKEADNNTCCG